MRTYGGNRAVLAYCRLERSATIGRRPGPPTTAWKFLPNSRPVSGSLHLNWLQNSGIPVVWVKSAELRRQDLPGDLGGPHLRQRGLRPDIDVMVVAAVRNDSCFIEMMRRATDTGGGLISRLPR